MGPNSPRGNRKYMSSGKGDAQTMDLETIHDAVLGGDAATAAGATRTALVNGISAAAILNEACLPAMSEVGRLYEIGEIYVPEMLIAARAMQGVLDVIEPLLGADGLGAEGKVVIGTVAGDLHDIGKNLVAMMLGGAGFEVIDLGTDVTSAGYVEAVREHEPDIVGLSTLLTTTMASIEDTIAALSVAGLRGKVKVIIGGAPITQALADKVGADGYAPDAAGAPRVAKAVLEPGRADRL